MEQATFNSDWLLHTDWCVWCIFPTHCDDKALFCNMASYNRIAF